jgi:hypothetical protein
VQKGYPGDETNLIPSPDKHWASTLDSLSSLRYILQKYEFPIGTLTTEAPVK